MGTILVSFFDNFSQSLNWSFHLSKLLSADTAQNVKVHNE